VVRGEVVVESDGAADRFAAGDNVLLPADTSVRARADRAALILLTDGFSHA
jgi:hypothetical protein